MRFIAVFCMVALLGSCTDRSYTPITPQALDIGTPFTVFTATNRAKQADGSYGYERTTSLQLLELTVSIPPDRMAGELDFAYAKPEPETQFTLAGQTEFTSSDAFLNRVRETLKQDPTSSDEIVLFVHGYNTTQAETAFRAAQFAYDVNLPGALMIYSWPSQGKLLGYAYDSESMLFARDGLEKVLRRIRGSGIKKLNLIGHSMGSALIMETLRQIEIEDPGWSKRSINGVVLISPDLDVDLFHIQMDRFAEVPDPFIIMTSGKDPVLGLSALLRGDRDRKRLGNINSIDQIADLPVQVVDTTAYSKSASSPHFVAGTSPALLAIFGEAQRLVDTFGDEKIIRDKLLPGDVVRTQKATAIRLTTPVPAAPG